MKVVIVGGGVAGLCTAYYLRKRDVDVTLLEARTLGSRSAASYGNDRKHPLFRPTFWSHRASRCRTI